MSPLTKGNEQALATLKNISGKKTIGRGGGGTKMAERNLVVWTTQQEGRLGMRMPNDRGLLALKTLLVVNSFKFHLNA